MFCPKCGARNQDELSYCRDCGENLKIVSQAMKKNSPVALISKLDAAIEKKNERFRRNAIFMGLAGGMFAVGSVIQALFLNTTSFMQVVFPIMSVMCLFFSGWFLLVYLRSLELPADSPGGHAANRPAISAIDDAGQSATDGFFCPFCGKRNITSTNFCSSCGQQLPVGHNGLAAYLPSFVIQKLDAAVANEKDLAGAYKNRRMLPFLAAIWLFLLVSNAIEGRIDMALLNAILFMSVVAISGWDFLTYRRGLEKEQSMSRQPQFDREASDSEPPKLFPDAPTGEFLENPTVPIGDVESPDRKKRDAVPLRQKDPESEGIGTAKLREETLED